MNKDFPKIQMPRGAVGGGGGMLKFRFDWYIRFLIHDSNNILFCIGHGRWGL